MNAALIFVGAFAMIAAKPLLDREVAVRQDTLGNYKIEYNVDGIAKTEERTADGRVSGAYSYFDANGLLRKIQYIAGPNGFQVVGGDLPLAPLAIQETPEVAAARSAHLALLNQGGSLIPLSQPTGVLPIAPLAAPSSLLQIPDHLTALRAAFNPVIPGVQVVQETPEVAAAKAAHLQAHLKALNL